MKYILIFLTINVLILGCNTTEEQYIAPIFNDNYKINVDIINDTSLFNNVSNILLYDSLLILTDINAENSIKIFSARTGNSIASHGKKGKGPGELLTPTIYSIDRERGEIVIYDYDKQGIMRYNISDILQDNNKYSFEPLDKEKPFLNNLRLVHDSIFISNGTKERVVLSTKSKILAIDNSFKKCNNLFKEPNEWYLFMNTHSLGSVSPDGTKYVCGTLYGGIIEIFHIKDNNSINLAESKYFYKPLFQINNGTINLSENTIFGFRHIYATNDYFYATLFGISNPTSLPNKIYKFDWQGNPIASYEFSYPIGSFVVDDDGSIYMIIHRDDNQVIGRAKLN